MQELEIKKMTLDELLSRLDDVRPYVLADSRDLDSYNDSHIPGAVSIPADQVAKMADQYDQSLEIITYCGSYDCYASTMAAKEFMKKGFRNVRDFKGGIKEWEDHGLPVESNK